jgi:hypothetical protein
VTSAERFAENSLNGSSRGCSFGIVAAEGESVAQPGAAPPGLRPRGVPPSDRPGGSVSSSFNDGQFGFLHVRLQTWFPFTLQVYVNEHEGLAWQMDQRGRRYRRLDRRVNPSCAP